MKRIFFGNLSGLYISGKKEVLDGVLVYAHCDASLKLCEKIPL
ncbi:MAG: hypothetical protein U0Z75_00975 [Deinococcaceae bacterium]